MAYLLKDVLLDAVGLPVDWHSRLSEIAAEKMKLERKNIHSVQLLSASVDSRRGTPKLLLTMSVGRAHV